MIKILFDRFSKVVRITEVIGIMFLMAVIFKFAIRGASHFMWAVLLFVIAEYLFIRFCATKRWYRDVPRWSGIELQFLKALVPTSYIIALVGVSLILTDSLLPPIVAAIFLAVVAHVNVILLYLRRKDTDRTVVNYYSSGRFLDEDKR